MASTREKEAKEPQGERDTAEDAKQKAKEEKTAKALSLSLSLFLCPGARVVLLLR